MINKNKIKYFVQTKLISFHYLTQLTSKYYIFISKYHRKTTFAKKYLVL